MEAVTNVCGNTLVIFLTGGTCYIYIEGQLICMFSSHILFKCSNKERKKFCFSVGMKYIKETTFIFSLMINFGLGFKEMSLSSLSAAFYSRMF
jgi:hypothetical protein